MFGLLGLSGKKLELDLGNDQLQLIIISLSAPPIPVDPAAPRHMIAYVGELVRSDLPLPPL